MKFSDFRMEINAIKRDGYEIIAPIVMDYGRTLGIHLRKEKRDYKIMLVECFYDTNSEGKMTKWHGIFDVRSTPWSRRLHA